MAHIIIPALIQHTSLKLSGLSYWKIRLTTGKEFSQYDGCLDLGLRHIGTPRTLNWKEDVVGSGDCAHVAELTLCTPHGDAHLLITRPFSAFQLNVGMLSLLGSERSLQAQIIGRVDDLETGVCTCAIWDILEQKLYTDHQTTVVKGEHDVGFAAWRPGVAHLGALALPVLGIQLAL